MHHFLYGVIYRCQSAVELPPLLHRQWTKNAEPAVSVQLEDGRGICQTVLSVLWISIPAAKHDAGDLPPAPILSLASFSYPIL